MVRKRRASKRETTAHRAKVARKIREHHRRIASNDKKPIRKRKDPGIPKELPFRDKVLAEAMEAKARKTKSRYLQKSHSPATATQFDYLEECRTRVWNVIPITELQASYGLVNSQQPSSCQEFISQVSQASGKLLKGGIPDMINTAKRILLDLEKGKLNQTSPLAACPNAMDIGNTSKNVMAEEVGVSKGSLVVAEFSPEFKL